MKSAVEVKAFLVNPDAKKAFVRLTLDRRFIRRTFGKAVYQALEQQDELFADGQGVTVSIQLDGKE